MTSQTIGLGTDGSGFAGNDVKQVQLIHIQIIVVQLLGLEMKIEV